MIMTQRWKGEGGRGESPHWARDQQEQMEVGVQAEMEMTRRTGGNVGEYEG
jgi:hypothetical protein